MPFASRPVRRSQLISPFGIGAMVNFPGDESLMPVVIDEWPEATNECPPDSGWKIRDERLEARLGVTHFRFPPDYRDADGQNGNFANKPVPMVRFPRWHYCHLCGGMEYIPLHEARPPRCKGPELEGRNCCKLAEKKRPKLMPVRFVAVCERGHIEDFPFEEWAHSDGESVLMCAQPQLRFRAGVSSASLAGVVIECRCGKKRSMASAFAFKPKTGGPLSTAIQPPRLCRGGSPWAGTAEHGASCGQHLRVVQRGGANVYFPRVVSSLYLQSWAKEMNPVILALLEDAELWEMLSSGTEDGEISLSGCRWLIGARKLAGKVEPTELRDAAQAKLESSMGAAVTSITPQVTEAEYRQAEHEALRTEQGDMKSEFYVLQKRISDYEPEMEAFFKHIHLVPKLRETRALEGFSRLNPTEGGTNMRPVRNNPALPWLPATLVYGEGIFLELNPTAITEWEARYAIGRPDHVTMFQKLNERRNQQQLKQRPLTPTFLLLHALAHALINQLSFDCGYGSASLRERLFYQREPGKPPMQGILIYTASGDSEGSMGGLVRQGQPGRLEPTLRRAIQKALWCSNDPVCLESHGQGADNCNLAACHSCLLLPETSCEEGNRLLDRGTLIGTHQSPSIGYFHQII